MSDYDYYYIDNSYSNATTIDDDFIGGTSVIIIGIASFVVVILIIIAIHLFSKKLNSLDCEDGYQQFNNSMEEIEPLPEYEERESHPDGEVDLSDYIQANNTINTIPRDTMNIINILNSNSQRNSHNNHSDDTNPSNETTNNSNNQENNNDEDINDIISIPSTSTLPLPKPEKENMPCIPPPCYDVALTQPRINNEGMIVLPQDPSFATNLPTLLRNSSSHRHYLRRSRQRLMRFFSHRGIPSSTNNNYRFPNHSFSVSSHITNLSSSSSNSDSNLNCSYHHHNNNNNSSNRPASINRRNSSNSNSNHRGSRTRSFLNHLHITHSSSTSSSRRHRRNLLRHDHSPDNASISSVSIYPTTMIDIPEDHYNITGNICRELRDHNVSEIERGCSSTTTIIPGINDISITVQNIHLEDNVDTTRSNIDTNNTDIQTQPSTDVLNNTDSCVDVTQYNPSSHIHHEHEVINIHCENNSNQYHHNSDNNSSNRSNNMNNNNINESNYTSSIHRECVNINSSTLNSNYHQININDEATSSNYENENNKNGPEINVITY